MTTAEYELPPCPICADEGEVFEIADPEDAPYFCMVCGSTFHLQ